MIKHDWYYYGELSEAPEDLRLTGILDQFGHPRSMPLDNSRPIWKCCICKSLVQSVSAPTDDGLFVIIDIWVLPTSSLIHERELRRRERLVDLPSGVCVPSDDRILEIGFITPYRIEYPHADCAVARASSVIDS